jgi:hypothetical protein
MAEPTPDQLPSADDDTTDVPLLSSWPAVYAFVLGSFALWVVLLITLARAFS